MKQVKHSFISTAYLRGYLNQLGYLVKVEVENRSTRQYIQAYGVKFFEGLPVSNEFCWQIQGKFPGFSHHICPTRIFLPTPYWQEILPYFPLPSVDSQEEEAREEEEKEAQENKIVNTQRGLQVNTLEEKKKDFSLGRRWLELSRQKGYQESIKALLKEMDNPEKVLSIEERLLLENYVSYQTDYYMNRSFRDYPVERYVPAETLEGIASTMYQIAYSLGFSEEGSVLNPCCGTGRFIKTAPYGEKVTALECDNFMGLKIVQKLYPQATILSQNLEQVFLAQPYYDKLLTDQQVTWLKDYPFNLIIGALPSGRYIGSHYSSVLSRAMASLRFERKEHFYLYYLSKLLKPGGWLIVLMSSHWMNSEEAKIDTLLSYRLEFAGSFKVASGFSGLDLQSEIMVFQRKESKEY